MTTNVVFTPADVDADVKCGTCTACCRKNIVVLTESDDRALYPEAVTIDWQNPFTGAPRTTVIPQINGACIYLGPAGCTIHSKRPKMCRVFSCITFVERVTEQTTPRQRRQYTRDGTLDHDVWRAGMIRSRGK